MPVRAPTDKRAYSDTKERLDAPFNIPSVVSGAGAVNGTAFLTDEALYAEIELRLHEFFQTAMAGANNDINVIARAAGVSPLTIAFVVAGLSTPLSIAKVADAITVNVATNGAGAAISTAAQVVAAINADAVAKEFIVAELQAGNDGTGIVAAFGATALAGPTGAAPTLDVVVQTMFDDTNWETAPGSPFPQKTTTPGYHRKGFGILGWQTRINRTLGGTTPAYAWSTPVFAHRS